MVIASEILDFGCPLGVWILDWSVKGVRSLRPLTLPVIQNPKSKIQNIPGERSDL
jgi:hypothetical protein